MTLGYRRTFVERASRASIAPAFAVATRGECTEDARLALQLTERAAPEIRFSPDALDLLKRGVAAQMRVARENRMLRDSVSTLEHSNALLQSSISELQHGKFELQGKLDHEGQIRRATLSEIERYRSKFLDDLVSYRAQPSLAGYAAVS